MTKHTPHFDALSLLPLRIALITAEKESPVRPPRQPRDPNEQLALQLIERIKHHGKVSFTGLKIESPRPLFAESFPEMAGTHAR